MLTLVGSQMGAAPRSSPAHVPEGEANAGDAPPYIQDVGSLMRSIASKQSMHTMTLLA
jgi:hypothetical protein